MTRNGCTLRLFGGFELRRDGQVIDLPLSVRRLLGFLALNGRTLSRCYVADCIWPDTDEEKAHANLRTALWRLHPLRRDVLNVTPVELALNPEVWVDATALLNAAREFRRSGVLPDPESLLEIRGELLPGHWDSWLVFDRERLRQEAVQLLESSSRACLSRGEIHLALMLGMGAVECDPLRESANLLVVRVRMVSGDLIGAIRHARRYAKLLKDELGVPPPSPLAELLWSHRSQSEIRSGAAMPSALIAR